MRWSLDALYPSFESAEFKADYQRVGTEIEKMEKWAKEALTSVENPVNKIEAYLHMNISFSNLITRLLSFAELSVSVDAKNERALKIIDQLENSLTRLTEPEVLFQNWLGNLSDLESLISASPLLEEHRFYLMELKEQTKYLLSEKEEVIISKMKNTGSGAWSKLQELLTSTLLVNIKIDGVEKQLPLPVIRNLAYEKDAALRQNAYEAELKAYEKIVDSSAAALNGIKGEVITLAELRGYQSPLEMTLKNARMDQEILDAMLTAMKESLPAFHKFYRKKAELLGHQNGLPFYDLFAPMGNADMRFTYDEARKFIVDHFRSFSDSLADFADRAFEEQWIDAEPREGKRGGAFCANLHVIKESRVLSNFTGSFSDVTTLAHELGHAYHGYCLNDESALNSHYPMPLAETASIFCETIIKNAALEKASEKEAFAILENDLSDSGQVIVDILSRYLFETELFKQREDSTLSVNELKEMMLNAQKEAYGNGLDHNHLHPYMWVVKPHYYYASSNFYNFPYAFGLLFAKGLYAEYLQRKDSFVKEYDQLLSVTGKLSIADVAQTMNIDLRSVDFWRNSLQLIEMDIETFMQLK